MCPAVFLPPMNRSLVAGVISILFVISLAGGMYSLFLDNDAEGFSPEDLHVPDTFAAWPSPDVPDPVGSVQTTPDVSVSILIGQLYKNYGGAIRLEINNNDSRSLFVLDVCFEWVGSAVDSVHYLDAELEPDESVEIKAMAVDGPLYYGDQDYRIKLRVLQKRGNGWFTVRSGGDNWLTFPEHTVSVAEMTPAAAYHIQNNTAVYYEKANALIDFDEPTVLAAANEATAGLGASYNIGMACAIFDYVDRTIVYTDDPGDDLWYEPEVCLRNRAGDCEDYSLLISTMINHAGGTARVYLTEGHAFAAVYVGNTTSQLNMAADGVRNYYDSELKLLAFQDGSGYWMFADPLGSFHLGGLAVGAIPSADSAMTLDFTFEDTGTVYAIDMTGKTRGTAFWNNPVFWISLVMVLGISAIMAIVWAAADKEPEKSCSVCSLPAHEEHYECECGNRYHHHCLPSQGFCINCGAPIEHPPPLPPIQSF